MTGISLLVSYLVNALWQAAVIAAAGWLASRALRRLGPGAEHAAWVVALSLAVLAPAAPLLRSLSALLFGHASGGSQLPIVLAAAPDLSSDRAGSLQWPWLAIWTVIALYSAAILFFAARIARSLTRIAAIVRRAQPQALTAAQEEMWSRCRRTFRLNGARLLSSPEVSGPVVAGVRSPVLIVPAGFIERCSASDLLAALAHECAHARRRDFSKNLCYEAISLALAFHPAMWFIKARIAQTREMICDRMAAENFLEPRSYAQSLLRLAALVVTGRRAATAHAIGIFDANILEKRIMSIHSKPAHAGRVARLGLTFCAMLSLAAAGALAGAKSIVVEPQTAAQSGKQPNHADGHVYKVGGEVSAPVPIVMPAAEFTKEARRKKFQGVVLISMVVDAQGNPQNPRVIRPLGMGLDQKALEAVRKYKFKPAMKDGKMPVAVAVTIEVNFKLY